LQGLHQVFFSKDPVFQRQCVTIKLVPVQFESPLPDHPFGDARGERFGLFRNPVFLFFFHIDSPEKIRPNSNPHGSDFHAIFEQAGSGAFFPMRRPVGQQLSMPSGYAGGMKINRLFSPVDENAWITFAGSLLFALLLLIFLWLF
jgi:hypothetical protein